MKQFLQPFGFALLYAIMNSTIASAQSPGNGASKGIVDRAALDQMNADSARARQLYEDDKLALAETLFTQVIQQRQRLLGDEHIDTLVNQAELANVYRRLRRFDEADTLYIISIEKMKRILGAEHIETQTTLYDLGQSYQSQRRFAEAEPLLKGAVAHHSRAYGPSDIQTLYAMYDLAYVIDLQSRAAEAAVLYRQVFDAGENIPALLPTIQLTGDRLIRLYSALGQKIEEQAMQGRLIPVLKRQSRAFVDEKLSRSLELMKNEKWSQARDALLSGLKTAIRDLGETDEKTIILFGTYANLLSVTGRPAEATLLLDKTFRLAENQYGIGNDITLSAAHNRAYALLKNGKLEQGSAAMREVIEWRTKYFGSTDEGPANSMLVLANGLLLQKKYNEALALYETALPIIRRARGDESNDVLAVLPSYARALIQDGRPSEALELLTPVFKKSDITDPLQRITRLNIAAALTEAQLNIPELAGRALETGEYAGALQSAVIASFFETDFERSSFLQEVARSRKLYRTVADAAWSARTLGGQIPDAALEALQVGTISPASLAVMVERERTAAGAQNASDRQKVQERSELTLKHDQLETDINLELGAERTNIERLSALLEQQSQLYRSYIDVLVADNQFEQRRQTFDTLFGALGLLVPPSHDEIRKSLTANEAVLLLVPAERGTHVVLLTDKGSRWVRSVWTRDQISEAVNLLRQDLAVAVQNVRGLSRVDTLPPYNRQVAYDLYRQIVEPVADLLQDKKEVFVVADGALNALPLSVLVTEAPQGADGDPLALQGTSWFGDRAAITQITSISDFVLSRRLRMQAKPQRAPTFIGYGDPVLNSAASMPVLVASEKRPRSLFAGTRSSNSGRLGDPSKIRELASLPGTAREIRAIANELGAPADAVYLGVAATELDVRSRDLSNVNVLAFATHGLIAGEVNGIDQPALVLTPPSVASIEDDGLLTALEIGRLKLSADWVVLSACNTASGSGDDNSGFSGLARAFFQAGARSLLVTHWPIRDDIAAELTVDTIRRQREQGLSPGRSLQAAMAAVRNSKTDPTRAHPASWAPFALVGNGVF